MGRWITFCSVYPHGLLWDYFQEQWNYTVSKCQTKAVFCKFLSVSKVAEISGKSNHTLPGALDFSFFFWGVTSVHDLKELFDMLDLTLARKMHSRKEKVCHWLLNADFRGFLWSIFRMHSLHVLYSSSLSNFTKIYDCISINWKQISFFNLLIMLPFTNKTIIESLFCPFK